MSEEKTIDARLQQLTVDLEVLVAVSNQTSQNVSTLSKELKETSRNVSTLSKELKEVVRRQEETNKLMWMLIKDHDIRIEKLEG